MRAFLAYILAIFLPLASIFWHVSFIVHKPHLDPISVRLYNWLITSAIATGIGAVAAAVPFLLLVTLMLRDGLAGWFFSALSGAVITVIAFAAVSLLIGGRLIGGPVDQLTFSGIGLVAGLIFRSIATDEITDLLGRF